MADFTNPNKFYVEFSAPCTNADRDETTAAFNDVFDENPVEGNVYRVTLGQFGLFLLVRETHGIKVNSIKNLKPVLFEVPDREEITDLRSKFK